MVKTRGLLFIHSFALSQLHTTPHSNLAQARQSLDTYSPLRVSAFSSSFSSDLHIGLVAVTGSESRFGVVAPSNYVLSTAPTPRRTPSSLDRMASSHSHHEEGLRLIVDTIQEDAETREQQYNAIHHSPASYTTMPTSSSVSSLHSCTCHHLVEFIVARICTHSTCPSMRMLQRRRLRERCHRSYSMTRSHVAWYQSTSL